MSTPPAAPPATPPATPPAAPPPAAFKDFVPQEYHDRGYLKDLLDKPDAPETRQELFKRLDGAQKLIGQRPGIPGDDAKPEEIEQFLAKFRPEKPDAYDFKALGEVKDEALVAVLRDSFHHAGAKKYQVDRFLEKLAPVFAERAKAREAEQKKLDDAFDKLVQDAFGAENAKVMETVNAAMKELTPDPLRPFVDKLPNEALAVMSGVIHAVIKKYGAEDKFTPQGGAGSSSGDETALRAELAAAVALPEYRDEFHPKHAEVRTKVADLSKKIAALAQK